MVPETRVMFELQQAAVKLQDRRVPSSLNSRPSWNRDCLDVHTAKEKSVLADGFVMTEDDRQRVLTRSWWVECRERRRT
jgi:hypothetical protein